MQHQRHQTLASRCSRMLPALLAWIMLLIVTGSFFVFVMPAFVAEFGTVGLIIFSVDVILSLCVATNFFMAALIDPGIIPSIDSARAEITDDFRTPLYKNVDIRGITVKLKWCISCHIYRPPRSSHCAICNQCIEIFDHHCPWVNNCIGRRNYRQFFLFLVSLGVHMTLVFSICLISCVRTRTYFSTKESITAITVMIVCAIFFLPIWGLAIFHSLLIFRGRTTNEQVTGRFRGSNNPFARGFFRNLIDVFCSPQRPRYSPCDHESENYFRQKLKNGKLSSSSFPIWDNNHNKRFALDHNNYKNGGNGCDDFNSNSNRLKRRLQPAISTSGNIYALNEKGVAELVHLPSNFSSDETQPLTTDKSFDMIITQAKDKIVTSLSRSSSRITIDDLSVLKMASNSQINRNDKFGTIFSSHCNLLDESASIRITNKNNDENFP